jgi:hypothetical protein
MKCKNCGKEIKDHFFGYCAECFDMLTDEEVLELIAEADEIGWRLAIKHNKEDEQYAKNIQQQR